MTEIGATLNMPVDNPLMVGSGSCGVPVPFRECRIVDSDGRSVRHGEVGELWVTGPGILEGYYKNADATAAAFRGKWFRTGDLFRQDENDYYYFVGRIKEVIRRSNENISAVEVETVLNGMPEVQQAAVVPVPDSFRGEEVKAYLVLRPGFVRDDVPPSRVFAYCAEHLAAFKVPRYVEYLDDIPLTSSNKTAKHFLVKAKDDLRRGSYDRVDGIWR